MRNDRQLLVVLGAAPSLVVAVVSGGTVAPSSGSGPTTGPNADGGERRELTHA